MMQVNQPTLWTADTVPDITHTPLTIKGNMQTISYTFSIQEIVQMDDNAFKHHVKTMLAQTVAKHIMNTKDLVSFVSSEDPISGNRTYKARFCLVPADLVQELYRLSK